MRKCSHQGSAKWLFLCLNIFLKNGHGRPCSRALADRAQGALASISSDAERLIHVKPLDKILPDQIERYRQKIPGRLVKRASEYISVLTLGPFDGLMTDFNEKDESVLAGFVQARVYVEGKTPRMRDQLYLALRLASLEKCMEAFKSMPVIVDDVLMDLDGELSQAALNWLSELARRQRLFGLSTIHGLSNSRSN